MQKDHSPDTSINVALIGNGYWGRRLARYLPTLFNVKHVADSKTNLKKIWKDVDAVVVATPIDTHFEIALDAIGKGKHVFIEKPIAMTAESGIILKKHAEYNGVQIAVDYTQTFSPGVKKMIEWSKLIGHVKYVEMSTKHLGRFMGFNVHWLLASHWLSVLDAIYPLDYWKASAFQQGGFDTSSILIRTLGTTGRIDVSLNYPGKEMKATIYGERGTVQFDALGNPTVQLTMYEATTKVDTVKTVISAVQTEEGHNLMHAVKYFYDLIHGREESNVDLGIKVTRLIQNL